MEAGLGWVLVVQLREEAVAFPPVYRVHGMGPTDQRALEGNGRGLWVGTPKSASTEMAVEGRRGWGGGGFP